jgi:hypothetical protein
LWNLKLFYDVRFDICNADMYHRFYDMATYLLLGTAVSFISPDTRLAQPDQYPDMFLFTLCIFLGLFLAFGRMLEILICAKVWKTPGLYPEAGEFAGMSCWWLLGSMLIPLANVIYCAQKYHSYNTPPASDHHRHMAGDEPMLGKLVAYDHIPIMLHLASFVATLAGIWMILLTSGNKDHVVWMCVAKRCAFFIWLTCHFIHRKRLSR